MSGCVSDIILEHALFSLAFYSISPLLIISILVFVFKGISEIENQRRIKAEVIFHFKYALIGFTFFFCSNAFIDCFAADSLVAYVSFYLLIATVFSLEKFLKTKKSLASLRFGFFIVPARVILLIFAIFAALSFISLPLAVLESATGFGLTFISHTSMMLLLSLVMLCIYSVIYFYYQKFADKGAIELSATTVLCFLIISLLTFFIPIILEAVVTL